MEASKSFENLLNHVKNSNLNFKLELSPFSAVISLKKSFVKDKSGNILLSSSSVESSQVHQIREENLALCQKILQQENAIKSLKCKYENAVDDSEEAHNVNKKLDDEI